MVLLKDFLAPTEGIHHSEPETLAFIGTELIGRGTLYISESVLCWISRYGDGFSLSYTDISIHAVSKDLNDFPRPCIFLIVLPKIAQELFSIQKNKESHDDEEDQLVNAIDDMHVEEEESAPILRFVPQNVDMLTTMFRALSDCQALNPDEDEEEDDEDDDAIIAPSFDIHYSNGASLEEFEFEDEEDMDDEDQFEDAEF